MEELEELEEWKSTVGRSGDRRNTYPVSFTLWLQLIRNRLSFERFSIDRLRRVARRAWRSHPSRRTYLPRQMKQDGGTEEGEKKGRERERERVWPAGGLTLSPRQLHPVFYARLFRRAFTVARPFSSALILSFLLGTVL